MYNYNIHMNKSSKIQLYSYVHLNFVLLFDSNLLANVISSYYSEGFDFRFHHMCIICAYTIHLKYVLEYFID